MMEYWLNKNQRRIVRFLFLLAALILIVLCGLTFYDDSIISILYLGQGRTVTIYREFDWEVNRGTKFIIRDGVKAVRPGCVIWYEDMDIENITLVSANSQDVIGLSFTFPQDPRQHLSVLYEFSSGRIWPCGGDNQDKNYLRKQLKQENPTLTLGD